MKSTKNHIEDRLLNKIERAERWFPPIFPDRPSPPACEFVTGPVTTEMARWAEAVSQFYYRKRPARAAAILAGASR